MDIGGYLRHGAANDDDELPVFVSKDVQKFLTKEHKGANEKHVRKIHATLKNIRRNGLQGIKTQRSSKKKVVTSPDNLGWQISQCMP